MTRHCKRGHIYDDTKNRSCPYCGEIPTVREDRCENCHELLGDATYCEHCGTKKGEGKFKPHDNFTPCVYGAPPLMSGIFGKKDAKKKLIYFLASGVAVCIIVLILILLNL